MTRYRTIVADPPWDIGDFPANFGYEAGKRTPYPTMSVEDIKALPVSALADSGAHLYLWTINQYLVEAHAIAKAWGFNPSSVLVWCKPPFGKGLGGSYTSNVEFILFCRRMGGPVDLAVTSALADAAQREGITRREVDLHMGTSDMAGWWLSRLEHRCRVPTPEQFDRLKLLLDIGDELDEAYRRARAGSDWDGDKVDTRWWEWPRGRHSEKPEAFLDIVESVSPAPRLEMFARRQRLGWDTWGNEALEHVQIGTA
jgi:N6-adenosine-specific RNA methylase IME4